MSCGTPVVAFSNSSIPEVTGESGVLVTDGDLVAMARAVERLLESPAHRDAYVAAGLQHAARFSWTSTAQATATVYEELLGR
jgi:glycosyltransferase involved in cell wall biosynthesis